LALVVVAIDEIVSAPLLLQEVKGGPFSSHISPFVRLTRERFATDAFLF
jgi:hypothetical protein